jgi:hypothetical protein
MCVNVELLRHVKVPSKAVRAKHRSKSPLLSPVMVIAARYSWKSTPAAQNNQTNIQCNKCILRKIYLAECSFTYHRIKGELLIAI